MASSVTIDKITNNLDGASANVMISGTPAGSFIFLINRVPDPTMASVVVSGGSGQLWTLTFPYPSLWYVWVQDSNGFSVVEAAVNISTSNDAATDECGKFLAGVLWQNRRGIEAFLHQQYPGQTLKQSIYGQAADIVDWPSMLVSDPDLNHSYAFLHFGTETTFNFSISSIIVHEDEKEEIKISSRLAEAILVVINQPFYNVFQLPSGVWISDAIAVGATIADMPIGMRMAAVAQIHWRGNTILQDPGGM